MSLVHRLLAGHFDLDTLVPGYPVPLRSLDVLRTRSMLGEIGELLSDTVFLVGGEKLYFENGYCDCPWLSAGCNDASEAFARSLAAIENCYLIETGAGTILHPVRSIQATPREAGVDDLLRDRQSLTDAESVECLRENNPEQLRRAVLRPARSDGEWVETFCVTLASHDHFHVRGNALFALMRLASRQFRLTRDVVQPLLEARLEDPHIYVSGQAHLAAETVERSLNWLIRAFDNPNPVMDVTTYSNGWIRCPNCNLRFASYDEWAFREGRCLRCRQRLRVTAGTN